MTTAKKRGSARKVNTEKRKAGRPRNPAKVLANRHRRAQIHTARHSDFDVQDEELVLSTTEKSKERDEASMCWIQDDDMIDASVREAASVLESSIASILDPITQKSQESTASLQIIVREIKLFPNIPGFNNTPHYQTVLQRLLQLSQIHENTPQQVQQLKQIFKNGTIDCDYTKFDQQLVELQHTHLASVRRYLQFVQSWKGVERDNPHLIPIGIFRDPLMQRNLEALQAYVDNPFSPLSAQQLLQDSDEYIEPEEIEDQSLSPTDYLNLTIRLAKGNSHLTPVNNISS